MRQAAKDVNIYGEGGVNMLSPAAIQLTTTADVKSFASGDTTLTSVQYSTLQAGIGAKCFGGLKSTVEAGVYAELKAGRSVSISSLRGPAEVRGKKITVGRHLPDLAQVPTEELELKATQKVDVDSKLDVHAKSGRSTHVEAGRDVKIEAQTAVRIQVGDFCVEVKPSGIKIGKGSNGTPSDPLVTIDKDTITVSSSGMGTKITKERVFVGKEGKHVTVTNSGTIFVRGKVIKLG